MLFRQIHGVESWESEDPSSSRVWWSDAGGHQNITFPVHPDPVSGMHCWHQTVRVRRAEPGDRYADICVDFDHARSVYRKWLALVRPAQGELRRPIWLFRPVKPRLDAYRFDAADAERTTVETADARRIHGGAQVRAVNRRTTSTGRLRRSRGRSITAEARLRRSG